MATPPSDPTPLVREEQLFEIFSSSEKSAQRMGCEMEKFGVRADGSAIGYDGPDGVLRLFDYLIRERGWQGESELEGGPRISLSRGGESITLEPGSQFELSGSQHDTTHAVADELVAHFAELAPISQQLGIQWLGLGFHPFSKRADYTFVPKQRYGIMREYLPTRGTLALDMMLRTSTVQVNYDYASEADAILKLQVGQALAPLTTALFANSPFYEGAAFGGKTFRGKVWLDMDPDRSGLIESLFAANASYADYVQWALDAPMFMVKRGDAVLANAGQRFRDFWRDGFEGATATLGDWQSHLNTLFPEVRLKRTIEVRGADSQGLEMAPALAALFAGLFYDQRALHEARDLTADYSFQEVQATRQLVPQLGLAAPLRGEPLVGLAERVLGIAEAGLERRALRRADGADERVHLAGLKNLVSRGETPADVLLRRVAGGERAAILAAATIPLG